MLFVPWKKLLNVQPKHKLFNRKSNDFTTLQMLCLLFESGFSNKEIETIIGIDLSKPFSQQAEIANYIKPYKEIQYKLDNSSFIAFILKVTEYKRSIREVLRKQLTYPLILFLTSIISMFFFKFSLLPTIKSSMSTILKDVNFIFYDLALNLIITTIFVLLLTTIIFIILWSKNILRLIMFHYLKDKKIFHIQKEAISIEFVTILHSLLTLGLSTKDCFETIHLLKDNWLMSQMAYQVKSKLEEGNDLIEIFRLLPLADDLKQFLYIGVTTNRLSLLLEKYLLIKEIQFKKLIKQWVVVIQSIAYILITAILFLLYQIIFSPMSILFQL